MKQPIQNIKITKTSSTEHPVMADFSELPGSPLVGYGKTEEEAIGNLVKNHAWWFIIERE